MDLTILAYATLGLSLFVSAVKMGGWILHADPRTILNGGRWALVALAALAVGVLLWLVMSGRWSLAMMLAAFMLPVFVQAAPRWRVVRSAQRRAKRLSADHPGFQHAAQRICERARHDRPGAGAAVARGVEGLPRANRAAGRDPNRA